MLHFSSREIEFLNELIKTWKHENVKRAARKSVSYSCYLKTELHEGKQLSVKIISYTSGGLYPFQHF